VWSSVIGNPFGALQIGICQGLSDRLRISLFKAGGKSSEAIGPGRHPLRFLQELTRAIDRCALETAFKLGQISNQATFKNAGIDLMAASDIALLGHLCLCDRRGAAPFERRDMSEFFAGHRFGRLFVLQIFGKCGP